MTTTTTIEAVRETLEAAVHALDLGRPRFRVERGEVDFREWAARNPSACHRRFSLRRVGEVGAGEVVNAQLRELEMQLELVVAYPHQLARYGPDNRQDLDDAIAGDAEALRDVVGVEGFGTYPAGSWPLDDPWSVDEGDGVSFLTMPLTIRLYRSTT